jgi:selenocysteine lyase/cysteine desulfurase
VSDFSLSTFDDKAGGQNFEDFLAWRRREFPFFENKTCLTHASVAPIPKVARDAVAQVANDMATRGQFDFVTEKAFFRCKERLAALLRWNGVDASVDEIAFASSTSHSIGLVATSFPWQSGENCVVVDGDFPANVVVWKNLEFTHGVETRLVPFKPAMDITVEDIAPFVDDKTRIVSLASCNFPSGYPLDLKTIGAWLHERGVLLCIDGIQTLGAVRSDMSEVDFICADGHKWMLGPNGLSLLWIRKEILKTMRPQILGWLAIKDRDNWFSYDTEPFETAERFEPGARNYFGAIALDASLGLLEELGWETIEKRTVHLRDYAGQKLQEAGVEVLWQPEPDKKSGIVSFRTESDQQTKVLYGKLDKNFALSIRKDRGGATWIRISAHGMNCEDDIDRLVAEL